MTKWQNPSFKSESRLLERAQIFQGSQAWLEVISQGRVSVNFHGGGGGGVPFHL